MAIVREITTLFDFEVNKSGFTQAEAAVSQVKSSMMALGKLFGIVLAADKIIEWVDEFKNVGKEINKLYYQIGRMARPGDDVVAAQKQLFAIAQNTGIEYTQMLDTYREFLNESKELGVTQDELLHTVDNIFKGLRLGAASPEQISTVLNTMNLGFRRGAVGMRQWGLLQDEAHDVTDAIGVSLGKNRDEMEAFVKAGKLTPEIFIKALGASNKLMNEQWAKRPRKLGEGFTYLWNEVALFSAELWKAVNTGSKVADMIVRFTDLTFGNLRKLITAFGGLNKLIEVLGITITVALGPKLIRMLMLATSWTLRWAAANALAALQWTLIAAGILAVTVAITDLVYWIRGGESFIGDFLGSFEDVMGFLKDKLSGDNLFKGFDAFIKLLQGDFKGAWEAFKESLTSVEGIIGTLSVALLALGAMNLLGITAGVVTLIKKLGIVQGATVAIKAGFEAWNTISFTGLLAALGRVVPVAGMIVAALYGKEWAQDLFDMALGRTPEEIASRKADREKAAQTPGFITSTWDATKNIFKKKPDQGQMNMLNSAATFGATPLVAVDKMNPFGAGMPPGATVFPPASNNVNQKIDVVVQIDPKQSIVDQVTSMIPTILEKMGRQINNSNPAVEFGGVP